MNNISLVGRLTRDPEVRYTQSAEPMAVARFSLAVESNMKKDKTNFINCVAFGKLAEIIETYGKKGMLVGATGELVQNTWEKEGQKHSNYEVTLNYFRLLEKKETNSTAPTPTQSESFSKFGDEEDDLPF